MVHWVIVRAVSIPFVNAPEVRLLADTEPTGEAWVETHAEGIVATLLPGLATARRPPAHRRKQARA